MSRFRLTPKVGYIERMKRIYGYLSRTKHYALRFRTDEPNYIHLPDLEYDWCRIYGNVLEEIPKDAPKPLGKSESTTTFLDANLLHDLITGRSCRIVGLQPLILLLQYVNRLGFEICSVNRTRKLGYINLNWPRCSARVTESLALTAGSFCQKQNTLYFRLCKTCEFMMCILIVDHQFNCMHPWCSWECMLPGRCSPGKRCHTFRNRNIVLLPILLEKVSCVSNHTLGEMYVVKFWQGLA